MAFLRVKHNMEVAHRLSELEGKCENIHGHSMWVEMKIHGVVNSKGVLEGLAFGDVKKEFRKFLDTSFDHHLLLNENDPWAQVLYAGAVEAWVDPVHPEAGKFKGYSLVNNGHLPGLMTFPGDPTTENLAKWIAEWAVDTFKLKVDVHVQETFVNSAGWTQEVGQ